MLVAIGMQSLTNHVANLMREVQTINDDLTLAERNRDVFEARVESYLREMNLVDAVLIRNRIAPTIGEQRLPLEVLQSEHPLALGTMTRAAMDQRVKRLVDHLDETNGLPERRGLAVIDLIEDVNLLSETGK